MSEIIDILMPMETGCATFTVDHAAAGGVVPLVNATASPVLYNGSVGTFFERGDSFTILTFGVILPLFFQFDRSANIAGVPPRVTLYLKGLGATTSIEYNFQELSLPGAGNGSYFYMIMENFDTPLDVYCSIPEEPAVGANFINNERFQLLMSPFNVGGYNISMINVPAALDTTVQYITPYLKILHNKPLATV